MYPGVELMGLQPPLPQIKKYILSNLLLKKYIIKIWLLRLYHNNKKLCNNTENLSNNWLKIYFVLSCFLGGKVRKHRKCGNNYNIYFVLTLCQCAERLFEHDGIIIFMI